ncbi:MAG TPA: hypothetical protein VGC39_00170, partial [Candidatus Methylacidiphilales bacterium]
MGIHIRWLHYFGGHRRRCGSFGIEERDDEFEEVLAKELLVNAPSFSREDEMQVVGREYHMACYGIFRLENGV